LTEFPNGEPNPDKHPDAPDVPGPGDVEVHLMGFYDEDEGGPMRVLACQTCHVPYASRPAIAYIESTAGGIKWPTLCCAGSTMQYYSADPLDPTDPDKSRWYPGLAPKIDSDGVERYFPAIVWLDAHWADWDQNDTPEDLSDDLLTPIIEWRMYQVIGSEQLAVVTDDDGDGRAEMNRPEEMLAFMGALTGDDSYGRQVAANPVLVKGPLVWYEDSNAPEGVSSFEHEGTGIPVKWYYYIWGQDHNVLPKEEAWGYDDPANPEDGCNHCHRFDGQSPVLDRLILVDPYDPDGLPVYRTVREMTGFEPP
jgi:hypothetical protein